MVAVSRLDFETYIPVAYEGMAITLKPSNISLCRLPPYLETEYAIATKLLCATTRGRLAEPREPPAISGGSWGGITLGR